MDNYNDQRFGDIPELNEPQKLNPDWTNQVNLHQKVNANTLKSNVLYHQYEQAENEQRQQRTTNREMKNIRVTKRNQRIFNFAIALSLATTIYGYHLAEVRRVESIMRDYPSVESLLTAYFTPNEQLNSEDRAVIEQVLINEHGVSIEEAVQQVYPQNISR